MNKHVVTGDGSSTFFSERFQEHFHSLHGAVQESKHVFIQHGLKEVLKAKKDIFILEVGLGTGLNVLLTYLESQNIRVKYTAVEAYPLKPDEYNQLSFERIISEDIRNIFKHIHESVWNEEILITDSFYFYKADKKIEEFVSTQTFDLIYFDAFSPKVQPELWSKKIFMSLSKMCRKGTVLVTYCAKGDVRRALIDVGFSIEKLPGPPGKREMIRAVKL